MSNEHDIGVEQQMADDDYRAEVEALAKKMDSALDISKELAAEEFIESTKEIKGDLMRLPQVIMDSQTKLYLLKKTYEQENLQLEIKESAFMKTILEDSSYTNEAKRKLALKETLQKDADYNTMLQLNKETKQNIDDETIRLEFYNNRFKAARSMADLMRF